MSSFCYKDLYNLYTLNMLRTKNSLLMKNLIKIISGFIFLLFISCSPQINYLGSNYTPTQNVDIFFDENDIQQDYTVMGIMKNEGDEMELDDSESVKNAMIKKAKSVGADAILFLGFYSEKVNNETTNIENVDKDKTVATSTQNTSKIYEAKLLKYQSKETNSN